MTRPVGKIGTESNGPRDGIQAFGIEGASSGSTGQPQDPRAQGAGERGESRNEGGQGEGNQKWPARENGASG
eukprot:9657844-Heterocapsa_arctica.AAC.1